MSTQDERKELMANPLPPDLSELGKMAPVDYTLVASDRVLTSIVQVDDQIQKINDLISPFLQNLSSQREALMDRAKKENIHEDAGAVIVELWGKQFRNEIDNIEKFRQTFKNEYKVIREVQEKDIEEKYKKQMRELEESKISLALADKYIGKDIVTEFVGYKPQTISYKVERK